MDIAGIRAAFVTAGLVRVEKDIERLARPSIRLSTTPVDEATLKIGVSRLGGSPDLPPGTAWPVWQNVPQSFIAQIRLDEVHRYDTGGLLPSNGMLWFFYDAQQQTYGTDPSARGGWQVLFANDISRLEHVSAPAKLPASSQFHACSLSFGEEMTLSQQPQLDIPHCDWTDEEQQKYETLLSTFPSQDDRGKVHHRLLGNPDTIQDDMRQQCQLASNGVTSTDDPRINTLSQGTLDWQLLLQVDTDESIGMRWANAGMLYYWLKQEDLRTQHFDKTWLVLQSE